MTVMVVIFFIIQSMVDLDIKETVIERYYRDSN